MLAEAQPFLGFDELGLRLHGPESTREETDMCLPALFIAGLSGVEMFRGEREEVVTRGRVLAGLSLGECAALCVAGVFPPEVGLKLVELRGEAMQEAA